MEYLRGVVLVIHLAGFAVLFGTWVAEWVSRRFGLTRLMDVGVLIAGVAGLALAAPWGLDHDLNYVKLGVKAGVLVVIGALVGIGSSRQKKTGHAPPRAMFWAVGILTIANVCIAVLWR